MQLRLLPDDRRGPHRHAGCIPGNACRVYARICGMVDSSLDSDAYIVVHP